MEGGSVRDAFVWKLLAAADSKIATQQFAEYFALRQLLADPRPKAREQFATRFASYYRLRSAGLTAEFIQLYFKRLFECSPVGVADPYTELLRELYDFPRRQGDRALQSSFVSKLVAVHDESRPIYDSHVANFFGMNVPRVGSVSFRIAVFVRNLARIQVDYESWARDPRFRRIGRAFFAKHPGVNCHPTRICDFLVWTIGANDLA